jgi:hypothetical protein
MVLDLGGQLAQAVELGRERVADRRLPGPLRPRDPLACGYESTVVTSPSAVPGFANRFSEIGRSTSRWISRSCSNTSVSRVTETDPSIEFSIGTTPSSCFPPSTAASTSGIDA